MKVFPRFVLCTSFSLAIGFGLAGCKSNQQAANENATAQDQNPSQDPAAANVAPISNASTGVDSGQGAPPAQTDRKSVV